MRVRLATQADIPAIVTISRKFYEASQWADLAAFCEHSAAATAEQIIEHGFLLMAEAGDQVIGVLGMYVAPFALNLAVRTATEVMWYVDPDARRGGAAIALLRTAKAEAIARGCRWSNMSVLATSPPQAAALYVRMGFRPMEATYLLEH